MGVEQVFQRDRPGAVIDSLDLGGVGRHCGTCQILDHGTMWHRQRKGRGGSGQGAHAGLCNAWKRIRDVITAAAPSSGAGIRANLAWPEFGILPGARSPLSDQLASAVRLLTSVRIALRLIAA